MSRVRLAIQGVFVLALLGLVSWPEHRHLRARSVWRSRGVAATAGEGTSAGARSAYAIGFGSAGYHGTTPDRSSALERKLYDNDIERRGRFSTPAAVLALGGRYNAILGYARTVTNTPITFAQLVLRNVVTGRVEARATADQNGRFLFLDVIPSGYVVELVGIDGSVLAASELLHVALGDVRETLVRTGSLGALAAVLGTLASTVEAPVAAAAAEGVSRVAQPDRTISPQR